MTHITSTMALTKRHATATNSNSNVSSTSNGTTTAQSTTIDPTCVRQAAWKRQQAKQQNKKQKPKSNYYYYNNNNNNTAIGRFLRLVRQGYGGIHPLTIQGSIILLLAILGAWWGNRTYYNDHGHHSHTATRRPDPRVQSLLQSMAGKAVVASSSVILQDRTHVTTRPIPEARTPILRIPRKWLLWEVDAVMDPFVQDVLFQTMNERPDDDSEEESFDSLLGDSEVLLAVYLAKELKLLHNHTLATSTYNISSTIIDDPIMRKYLRALPSFRDYQQNHPLFWNHQQLAPLRRTSAAHDLIQHYQERVQDSYHKLLQVSDAFLGQFISLPDFLTARLHVWTRSFGTGPLDALTTRTGVPISFDNIHNTTPRHDYYDSLLHRMHQHGCHSMVPILDLYNHHARPNVGFGYDTDQHAFVVHSTRAIQHTGQELFDSYGKHSEAHLLAKYGFVNADGSDWTQASLAVYHAVYSHGLPAQLVRTHEGRVRSAGRLLRYLQLDDGYEECITSPSSSSDAAAAQKEAWSLKILKFQHLRQIAREPTRWNVFLHPRSTTARPPKSSSYGIRASTIPTYDPQTVQLDINPVLATCRLLVLTHHDYNGTATELLRDNLATAASFRLPVAHGDALHFRELMCLLRLADMALRSYERPFEEARARLQELWDHNETSSRIEWMSRYMIYSEMEALQVVKDLAAQLLHQSFGHEGSHLLNSEPAYTMQQTPCPILEELLEYVD